MTLKSKKKTEHNQVMQSLILLLDKLTDGNGINVLDQIKSNSNDIDRIAIDIAAGNSVEVIRKLHSTYTKDIEWLQKPNFAYVGLPNEALECRFEVGFDKYIKGRVGKRAEGFAHIFSELAQHKNPTIIETGCLRVANNWEGDGQSTFQFDWYARENRGHVITIDNNQDSIDSARLACSSVTSAVLNDSVSALNTLSDNINNPVALIYLDSFDVDLSDPMPSAIHHAMEVMAARSLIGEGTIICVDDFNIPSLGPGGKGLIVDRFMDSINAKVIYTGYQKIWKM